MARAVKRASAKNERAKGLDVKQTGTLGDLAVWCGISMKTAREYSLKGLFVRAGATRWQMVPSVNAYTEFLRKSASGRSTISEASKARLLDAQAQQAEAKAGLLAGTLIQLAVANARWATYLRTMRSMILAIPSRVGGQVPGLGLEVLDVVDREVRNVLTEMANVANIEPGSAHPRGGEETSDAAAETEAEPVD